MEALVSSSSMTGVRTTGRKQHHHKQKDLLRTNLGSVVVEKARKTTGCGSSGSPTRTRRNKPRQGSGVFLPAGVLKREHHNHHHHHQPAAPEDDSPRPKRAAASSENKVLPQAAEEEKPNATVASSPTTVAAIKIQAFWRRYLCREQYLIMLNMEKSATDFFVAEDKKKKDEAAVAAACTIIQAFWRGELVRMEVEIANFAASMIQSTFRGYACRQSYQRSNKVKQLQAVSASKIQSTWRMKNVLLELEMANFATAMIQAQWRRYAARSKHVVSKERSNIAAKKIQSIIRMKLVLLDLELSCFAAAFIQCWVRRYLAQCLASKLRTKKEEPKSIAPVQDCQEERKPAAAAQSSAAKLKHALPDAWLNQPSSDDSLESDEDESSGAAGGVGYGNNGDGTGGAGTGDMYGYGSESAANMMYGYGDEEAEICRRLSQLVFDAPAKEVINCDDYTPPVRLKLAQASHKDAMAMLIQAQWRKFVVRIKLVLSKHSAFRYLSPSLMEDLAAAELESCWPMKRVSKELRRIQAATTTIQASWRCFSVRSKYAPAPAASGLGAFISASKTAAEPPATEEDTLYGNPNDDISVMYGYDDPETAMAQELVFDAPAKEIVNCDDLTPPARLKLAKLSQQDGSAILIQTQWRKFVVRIKFVLYNEVGFQYFSNALMDELATAELESCWHMQKINRELQGIHSAAFLIQATWRGCSTDSECLATDPFLSKDQKKPGSSLLSVAEQLSPEDSAAAKIQSVVRMKLVLLEFELYNFAITIIQAQYRRWRARYALSTMKALSSLKNPAKKEVQRDATDDLNTPSDAATIIQALWRGKMERLRFELYGIAAVIIQSHYRRHAARFVLSTMKGLSALTGCSSLNHQETGSGISSHVDTAIDFKSEIAHRSLESDEGPGTSSADIAADGEGEDEDDIIVNAPPAPATKPETDDSSAITLTMCHDGENGDGGFATVFLWLRDGALPENTRPTLAAGPISFDVTIENNSNNPTEVELKPSKGATIKSEGMVEPLYWVTLDPFSEIAYVEGQTTALHPGDRVQVIVTGCGEEEPEPESMSSDEVENCNEETGDVDCLAASSDANEMEVEPDPSQEDPAAMKEKESANSYSRSEEEPSTDELQEAVPTPNTDILELVSDEEEIPESLDMVVAEDTSPAVVPSLGSDGVNYDYKIQADSLLASPHATVISDDEDGNDDEYDIQEIIYCLVNDDEEQYKIVMTIDTMRRQLRKNGWGLVRTYTDMVEALAWKDKWVKKKILEKHWGKAKQGRSLSLGFDISGSEKRKKEKAPRSASMGCMPSSTGVMLRFEMGITRNCI